MGQKKMKLRSEERGSACVRVRVRARTCVCK